MDKFKIYKQDKLVVASNVIIFRDSFIQIRNITRIWHGRPEIRVPIFKLFFAIVIGIAIQTTPFGMIGILIILGVLGVIGYYAYLFNLYTLNFELSSGEVYAFTSVEKDFLKQSYEKIKELIDNKKLRNVKYEVNFNSCDIDLIKGDNNILVNGKNNVVNKGNNNSFNVNQNDNSKIINNSSTITNDHSTNSHNSNSFNSNIKINYEVFDKELAILLKMSEIQSNKEDLKIINEAKELIKQKNASKLKDILKNLSKITLHIIETTSSLMTISEFIKNIKF